LSFVLGAHAEYRDTEAEDRSETNAYYDFTG
jgi:hypothetical protein